MGTKDKEWIKALYDARENLRLAKNLIEYANQPYDSPELDRLAKDLGEWHSWLTGFVIALDLTKEPTP